MKKTLAVICCLAVLMAGCKKDSAVSQPQPTKTQLLTNNTWQIQEIIQQLSNTQGRYVRGGINTTGADYSKSRLTFKADGTGSFTDPLSHTYSLTWSFAPGDETKMTVTVNYSTPAVLNYSFISLDENNFYYTVYYVDAGGTNALAIAHYIPI